MLHDSLFFFQEKGGGGVGGVGVGGLAGWVEVGGGGRGGGGKILKMFKLLDPKDKK